MPLAYTDPHTIFDIISPRESSYTLQDRGETLSTIANKLRLDADRVKERNKSHLYGLNGSSHLKSGTALNPGMVVYYDASLDQVLVGEKVLKRCHRDGPSYDGKVEAHAAEKGHFTGVRAIGI